MNSTNSINHRLHAAPTWRASVPPCRTRSTGLTGWSRGREINRTIHLVLALFLAALCARNATAQSSYTPTDIRVPEGDTFRADAMNDNGEVVGGYTPAGGYELPGVWRNGALTQLPLLPGAIAGWTRGLNNNGQMVGACSVRKSDGTYAPQACIWENGIVRALPLIAGTNSSAAWAINDVGTIIGHVYTPLSTGVDRREAVLWQGSSVTKLIAPTAGAHTWARAIDSVGRIAVSWSNDSYSWYPARWTPQAPNGSTGTMTSLDSYGEANDINDAGVVCGYDVQGLPVVWEGLAKRVLFENPGGYGGAGHSINQAGTVVGSILDEGYSGFAWIWDANGGTDLNTLLSSSSTYAYPGNLMDATSINSSGQILVSTNQGSNVLLTPSSEPPVLSDLGDHAAIEPLQRNVIDRLRAKVPAEDAQLAGALAELTLHLLAQKKFSEAEAPARESLAIREKATPDDWRTFNSRSMLGGSLLGQKKYSEAEPLLLSGYEGMKQRENSIPAVGKMRLREALQRLSELCEATGEKEKASEWKKKVAEFEEAGTTRIPAAATTPTAPAASPRAPARTSSTQAPSRCRSRRALPCSSSPSRPS